MTNIEDLSKLREIEQAADQLIGQLKDINAPEDAEIVLAKTKESTTGEDVIAYYVATTLDQCILWFEDLDVFYVTEGERAVVSETHLGELVRNDRRTILTLYRTCRECCQGTILVCTYYVRVVSQHENDGADPSSSNSL